MTSSYSSFPDTWLLGSSTGAKAISLNQLATAFPALFGSSEIDSADTVEGSYQVVPWVFRAVNLAAHALAAVPYALYRGKRPDDDNFDSKKAARWPFEGVRTRNFLWKTSIAQSMWGAAYWKIDWDRKTLFWLNPQTMTFDANTKGITWFIQTLEGKETRFPPEDICYLPTFNPESDLGPGVARADVALRDAVLSHNITSYAANFFEHGAIPPIILTAEHPLQKSEEERLRTVWQKLYGGIKNAWRTAILGRGIKPEVVGHAIQDLAMPELTEQSTRNIAASFDMSITFLRGEAANYATAVEESTKYYYGTVMPDCLLMEEQLDAQLWEPINMHGHFRIEDVEPIQQYETMKAQGQSSLMEELMRQADGDVLTRDRAVYLAEQLWGTMGFTGMAKIPDEEPKEPEPQPMTPFQPGQPQPPEVVAQQEAVSEAAQRSKSMESALRQWRRFVKKRGVEGALARGFHTDAISHPLQDAITKQLSRLDTEGALDFLDELLSQKQERFVPLTGGEDLMNITFELDPAAVEEAVLSWDEIMPDEARGLLNAMVVE